MNTTQNHTIYDVIIAGAGPVGLFLACELAMRNCSVLILEKTETADSPLKRLPFGIRGLSTPSIESLYRRDLFKDLEIHKQIKNPHMNAPQGARRQLGHFAGIPFHEGDVDFSQWQYRLLGSSPTSVISEMQELDNVFSNRAKSLGVEIGYGSAISGFEQTDNCVMVQAGNQIFQAQYLVGCDGARSVVRKLGDFKFAGTEPEFTGYNLLVDIADPEKLKPGRNVTERGMYLQSQPGYVIMQDFDGGAFRYADQPITLEHAQAVLRRISDTDVTLTALHVGTTWTDLTRQATAYRNGRVLLAGDAAHIHSPLGGQGLNLGLGDAMNLGWKLAATINDQAPAGLLDTYFAERHPVGEQVLDWSRAQVAIMGVSPKARALNAIMRDLLNTSDGATYMAARVWGINTRYDLGSNHPLVGRSVPNFELADGRTVNQLLQDGKAILLDFKSVSALEGVLSAYNGQVRYVSSVVKYSLGAAAVLIRPDGIIAWATDSEPDLDNLQNALSRWFVSHQGK